jgi:endonuclease III
MAALPKPRMTAKDRARLAAERLKAIYPAVSELEHKNPFQMLIATILSAQTTDRSVNAVTPKLFAKYPDAAALAHANPRDVEAIIKPTGFYHVKAKTIIGASAALVERFHGEVPPRIEDLVTLPGVGRKTANVVLGVAFGVPGFAVDTHVKRLTRRLGLTKSRLQPALDPARPPDLRRPGAALPGVRTERLLPVIDGSGEGPAASLDNIGGRRNVGSWPTDSRQTSPLEGNPPLTSRLALAASRSSSVACSL